MNQSIYIHDNQELEVKAFGGGAFEQVRVTVGNSEGGMFLWMTKAKAEELAVKINQALMDMEVTRDMPKV